MALEKITSNEKVSEINGAMLLGNLIKEKINIQADELNKDLIKEYEEGKKYPLCKDEDIKLYLPGINPCNICKIDYCKARSK